MEQNKKPLVSVVIPTFKRPDTLDRAINSALNQTYINLEVIVVDDNNPESEGRQLTEEKMKMFEGNDRVIYLKHPYNKNGSAARNTGARYSKAKYIAFLDDDDEFLPGKIAAQVERLENLPGEWGLCYSKYFTRKLGEGPLLCKEEREGSLYFDALVHNVGFCAGSNLLIRKEVFDQVGGFDETFIRSQDHELLTKLLKNFKIAYSDEPGLIVNIHAPNKNFDYEEIYKKYIETFKTNIDELSDTDKKRFYRHMNLNRFYHLLADKHAIGRCLLMIFKGDVNIYDVIKMIWTRGSRILLGKIKGTK